MCGGGGLRDSGTIRRSLPLENFTHQRGADLLRWSLRKGFAFSSTVTVLKVLPSGQLPAEEATPGPRPRGGEIERRNAPERG